MNTIFTRVSIRKYQDRPVEKEKTLAILRAAMQAAIDAVRQLSVDVGIPTKLEKLRKEDLPFLCESAAADACAPGNPRHAELADFEAMFRKLM